MKKILTFVSFICAVLTFSLASGAEKRPLNAENTGSSLKIRGNALYVCTPIPAGKIAVFDISAPDRPILKAQHESNFYPSAMTFGIDNTLLVVDTHDLLTFDIKDPAALKLISKQMISEDPVCGPVDIRIVSNDEKGKNTVFPILACRKAGVKSNGKFIADLYARTLEFGPDGLYAAGPKSLVRINKHSPLPQVETLASLAYGTPVKLRSLGDTFYLAQGFHGISIFRLDDQIDNKTAKKIKVFRKVSDGGPINEFSAFGTFVYDMVFDATGGGTKYLYAAAGETGIVSADISDSGKIKYLALCDDLLWHSCTGLAIKGKRLYVFDRDLPGICVIDISDPLRMKVVSKVNF